MYDSYTNGKMQYYNDKLVKITATAKPIFHEKISDIFQGASKPKRKCEECENRADNIKRSRDMIFNIAYLNHWDYFITLTINKEMLDRENTKLIEARLRVWLNNQSKRSGIKYVLIPEYHKDGKSIHFHGLITEGLHMTDSGKIFKGRAVYNINEWKFGFTTAIKLDGNIEAVSKYVTKYITKNKEMIFNRYYFSSQNLNREPQTTYFKIDYDSIPANEIYIPGADNYIKYYQTTIDRVNKFIKDYGLNKAQRDFNKKCKENIKNG